MVAYFERHESDKQGETWDDQGKGWQAWNGWGGDEGFAWAKRKVEEFDRQREKKSCGCGCAKIKSVKQSEFVGKHANDFGAWLMTKSAEKEAAKIAKSEAEAAAKVSIVFDAQVEELLEKLASTERPTPQLIADAERIMRSRGYQRSIVEALAPYLREAIATGAEIGIDTVSKIATEVDFSIERRDLAAYADTESIRLSRQTAAGVVETQSVRVREVLGRIASGRSPRCGVPWALEAPEDWQLLLPSVGGGGTLGGPAASLIYASRPSGLSSALARAR